MIGLSMPHSISDIDMNRNYSKLSTYEINMSENISGTKTLIQTYVLHFFFVK